MYNRLKRLGISNQIVDDSDSKPSKYECLYWYDSKSDDEIELYQIVSINLFSIKIDQFSIKIALFWIKRSKKGY